MPIPKLAVANLILAAALLGSFAVCNSTEHRWIHESGYVVAVAAGVSAAYEFARRRKAV